MSDDLAESLRSLLAQLAGAGVSYMIVGSVAALAHGRARSTQDVDIVIDVDLVRLRAFVRGLPPDRFYVSEDAALDALRRRTMFNVIDMRTGWKADLIPLKPRGFSHRELARRVEVELFGARIFVATVEDTIVAKLEWSALAGGSARQIEDAVELAKAAGPRLDIAYVEAAAAEVGVTDAWRALARDLPRT